MVELFERGGFMMYPLFLASILAVTIIIERAFSLRKNRIIIPEVINVVEQFSSFKDMELARNICAKFTGPLSTLIWTGLDNTDLNRADIKELISLVDFGHADEDRHGELACRAQVAGQAGAIVFAQAECHSVFLTEVGATAQDWTARHVASSTWS